MAFQLKLAGRLQEIVPVFTVAGFGDLFRSCRMTPKTSVRFSWNGPREEGDDPGERRESVEEFLSKYGGKPMGLKDLASMVGDLLSLVRENKLTMPPDQAMLLKVFVSLGRAFKKLDPAFDVMVAMQPALQAVIDRRTETHRSRSLGAHVDRPR